MTFQLAKYFIEMYMLSVSNKNLSIFKEYIYFLYIYEYSEKTALEILLQKPLNIGKY